MMWTIACGVVVGLGLFKAFEGLVEMVVEYPEVLLWLFKLPFKLPALLDRWRMYRWSESAAMMFMNYC